MIYDQDAVEGISYQEGNRSSLGDHNAIQFMLYQRQLINEDDLLSGTYHG